MASVGRLVIGRSISGFPVVVFLPVCQWLHTLVLLKTTMHSNDKTEHCLFRIELCSLYSILVCKCFRFDNEGNVYFEPGRNKSPGKNEVLQWQWRKR